MYFSHMLPPLLPSFPARKFSTWLPKFKSPPSFPYFPQRWSFSVFCESLPNNHRDLTLMIKPWLIVQAYFFTGFYILN